MRLLKLLVLLALFSSPAWATTWYATSSSVNINASSLWVPTTTGSCTGSGTALSFGSQANGDVFDANGCTAIAVNVDPGSVSVQVTLETDSTNGGGFTCATASGPATIHANITATKTAVMGLTGSSGSGCNVSGNITGGTSTSTNGVNDSHTSVTITVTGNLLGGSAANSSAWAAGAGPLAIIGNVTGSSGYGLTSSSTGAITVTGNCIGSDTASTSVGCNAGTTTTDTITITGAIVNGKGSQGSAGRILISSTITNYIVIPENSSYSIANCLTASQITAGTCTNALILPANPGIGNVTNGTNYGPFTGTYVPGASGTVSATGNW